MELKACKVTFSLELLLQAIGLDQSEGLTAFQAYADAERGTVTICLTGDHPSLPECMIGETIPDAVINCKRVESRLVLLGVDLASGRDYLVRDGVVEDGESEDMERV